MAFIQRGLSLALRCAIFSISSILILPAPSQAAWEIQPFVETRAAYSDNVNFDEDGEDSDVVLQLSPGITVQKLEGRLQVQLDYLLQNFYSFDGSDLSTDHNLDAFSTFEWIDDRVFIDSYATITQVLVDTSSTASSSNLNSTGNTTDELTLGLEPRWMQPLGGYLMAELAYLYEIQRFEDTTDDDGVAGDIDDRDSQRFLATLRNQDQETDRLDWAARYQNEKVDFKDSDTVKFRRGQIDLGYALASRFQLVGSYGYENNDFEIDPAFADEDDTFWDAGFIVGAGEFSTLEVRRGERFFGNTWFGELNVAGNRINANLTYEEEIEVGDSTSADTRSFLTDPIEIDNDVVFDVTGDRNSVSESKRWDLSLAYTISKSTITVIAFDEDERFLDTLDEEDSQGYGLSWLWQITGVSSLEVVSLWDDNESVDAGVESESDFFELGVRYTRALSPNTDVDAGYVYNEGNGDQAGDDFEANTIDVGLVHRF